MPTGCWIVRVDVSAPDTYARYLKANAEPLGRFGATFLVRGRRYEVVEGAARAA